jgi:medium-chain acyl-[acyl-carrier-protein] hydrolase
VRLPGREGRLCEPAPASPEEAAATVTAAAETAGHRDRPIFWFGACSGSVLAFEAARRDAHLNRAVGLIVASRMAPSVLLPSSVAPDGDDDAIVRELTTLGGLDPELLASQEALDLLLPAVRADQRLVDGYQRPIEPRLELPLLALCGRDDALLDAEDMAGWQQHTSAVSEVAEVPGGHFLLTDSPQALMAEVASFVTGLVPGAAQ